LQYPADGFTRDTTDAHILGVLGYQLLHHTPWLYSHEI